MRRFAFPYCYSLPLVMLCMPTYAGTSRGDSGGWIELSDRLEAFKQPTGRWVIAGQVRQDPNNPTRLVWQSGQGALVNGPTGRTANLITRASFGDIELELEFMIPQGSNSGIKFEGLYEIQIRDSWRSTHPTGNDCGGIYPRAEQRPRYHHIDEGVAPRTNAARPPGEWQTLHAVFQAPRFDADGNKVAHARFVKVELNGKLIHEDVEVPTPTGHVWREREWPTGCLLLQADHGPVAFRNVRVRPWAKADDATRE